MATISCNKKKPAEQTNDISFVSTNHNYVFSLGNNVTFTFVYSGRKDVKKISTVDILNTSNEFSVKNDPTEWELDENKQFSVTVSLSKEITETHITQLSFVFTYYDSNNNGYYEVVEDENIKINCEYQTISLVNSSIDVDVTGQNRIKYTYQINCANCPTLISNITPIESIFSKKLQIGQSKDVHVDETTHQFSVWIFLQEQPTEESFEFDFTLTCYYDVCGQSTRQVTQNAKFVYCSSHLFVKEIPTSCLYSESDGLPIILNVNTAIFGYPKQIDKLELQVIDKSSDMKGTFKLDQDTNIRVSSNGDFFVNVQYIADPLDPPQSQVTLELHASFKIDNLVFKDVILEHQFILTTIREVHYEGTKVFAYALEAGELNIPCMNLRHELVDQTRHVMYKKNNGPEQTYVWNSKIEYQEGDTIELWADDNDWSTEDYHFVLNFTGKVTIQGDVTSLIDGVGGKIKELVDEDEMSKYGLAFERLFEESEEDGIKSNVVKISKNFLSPTSIRPLAYSAMFIGNKNLLFAPDLNCIGHDRMKLSFGNMFAGCTNLIKGPTTLPDCEADYSNMFGWCENLMVAPIILNSTFSDRITTSLKNTFVQCKKLQKIVFENFTGEFTEKAFENWLIGSPDFGEVYYKGDQPSIGENYGIPESWDIIKEW